MVEIADFNGAELRCVHQLLRLLPLAEVHTLTGVYPDDLKRSGH